MDKTYRNTPFLSENGIDRAHFIPCLEIVLSRIFPNRDWLLLHIQSMTDEQLGYLLQYFNNQESVSSVVCSRIREAYYDILRWKRINRSLNLSKRPLPYIKNNIIFKKF